MDLTPWNPWNEIARAREEAERLFDAALEKLRRSLPGSPISFVPPVDLVEGPDEYRLYVAIPGAVEEDLDIAVEGDVLIIRGELERPYSARGVLVREQEWRYGYFERRVQMPRPLAEDEIRASYEGGVLTISIPKARSEGASSAEGS